MQNSQWQLKGLSFPNLVCTSNADFNVGSTSNISPSVKTEAFSQDASEFCVNVRIEIEPKDRKDPYEIKIHAFGTFVFAEDLNSGPELLGKELADRLNSFSHYRANAIQILYGAAREILAGITSRAPWGVALLPVVMIDGDDCDLKLSPEIMNRISPPEAPQAVTPNPGISKRRKSS